LRDLETVFQRISEVNHWGNAESVSGDGSTLEYTYNLRHELAKFLRAFKIGSMCDAPCGDFNWMRAVDFPEKFEYVGGEIVPSLVETNRSKYETETRRFQLQDITADQFPDVDLWFCRDCLFHLPTDAILRALKLFAKSRMKYVMTTTHLNTTKFRNRDIAAGRYRKLDLYATPYHLPRDVLYRIPDYVFPYPQRELCVWTRAQVAAAIGEAG
jgi:hypothetical protein